jgi:hypothetical protein
MASKHAGWEAAVGKLSFGTPGTLFSPHLLEFSQIFGGTKPLPGIQDTYSEEDRMNATTAAVSLGVRRVAAG